MAGEKSAEKPKEEVKKEKDEKLKEEKKDEKENDPKKDSTVKSSRPESTLSVDPDTAYFNPGGGNSEHMLVNTSNRRLAVKIRCSNNQLYRVHPVTMFVGPGECQHLSVTRHAGPARADKLVVQFIPCTLDEKDAKEFYAKLGKDAMPETVRINLKMADQRKTKYTSMEVCE